MTTEHTPPPWRFDPYNNSIYGSDIRVARDITVEADGSLIIAAPDAIALLEKMIANNWVLNPVMRDEIKAIIAKAKGDGL